MVAAGIGGGPPGSIDVSAANQDVLVRAGVVAIQGDVIGGALGLAASSGQSAPLGKGLRKRIAALGSPVVDNCFVSGPPAARSTTGTTAAPPRSATC